MKSLVNKIFALVLLILTFPIFLIVSIIIFFEDGFPIFYIQKNYGINNSIFDLFKFRTMKKNSPQLPTEEFNDVSLYLLKSGKIFRKYSIDELPQFYNVLKGDMLFIGPRPCMVENEEIIKDLRSLYNIEKIKPGITGWAQVNGRDLNSYEEKVNLDKYYYNNMSFLLDIKIILKTFVVVLFKNKDIKH